MFKNLTDLSYRRTMKEAFGFYLAFFLLGILTSALGGMVFAPLSGAVTFEQGFTVGMDIGVIVAILYTLMLSSLLVFKKKLLHFQYFLFVPVSALLAGFGGLVLGLLLPAWLTTRAPSRPPLS